MSEKLYTTAHDVALDTVAALDMFAGMFGGDNVTIESVDSKSGPRSTYHTVVITLSNGDVYELEVNERSR